MKTGEFTESSYVLTFRLGCINCGYIWYTRGLVALGICPMCKCWDVVEIEPTTED